MIALILHYSAFNYFYLKLTRYHYILMFHRISNDKDFLNISFPKSYFKKVLDWSSDYGALTRLSSMVSADIPEVRFAMTFDDGYESILQLRDAPEFSSSTVYLSTSYIGQSKELWAIRLELAIHETRKQDLNLVKHKMRVYSLATMKDKIACFNSLNFELKERSYEEIEEILVTVYEELDVPLPIKNTFLNWNEVDDLKDLGIEIGAHTHNHIITSKLTRSELQNEINISNRMIENSVLKPPLHFAYPNGRKKDIASFAEKILRDSGYESAVTTIEGPNKIGDNPYRLKRYNLSRSRIETPWDTPSKAMYTTMLVSPFRVT